MFTRNPFKICELSKIVLAACLVCFSGCATTSSPQSLSADDLAKAKLAREKLEKGLEQTQRLTQIAYRLYAAVDSGSPVVAPPFIVYLEMGQKGFWDTHPPHALRIYTPLQGYAEVGTDIRRDDLLLKVNGLPVDDYPSFFSGLQRSLDDSKGHVELELKRDGQVLERKVPVVRFNAFYFTAPYDFMTAFNNNPFPAICIPREAIRMAENDDELAFLIALGMSHQKLAHKRTALIDNRQDASEAAGQLAGQLLARALFGSGAMAYAPLGPTLKTRPSNYTLEDEIAADAAAIPLLRRAGYDPRKGLDLLKRIEIELAGKKTPDEYDALKDLYLINADRSILFEKELQKAAGAPVDVKSSSAAVTEVPAAAKNSSGEVKEVTLDASEAMASSLEKFEKSETPVPGVSPAVPQPVMATIDAPTPMAPVVEPVRLSPDTAREVPPASAMVSEEPEPKGSVMSVEDGLEFRKKYSDSQQEENG